MKLILNFLISSPHKKNQTMTKYVALLRGVNVGGGNKILMSDLKLALTKVGLSQLVTYIQSGNLVFCSELVSESDVAKLIEECIFQKFELSIPCIVFTETRYKQLVNDADWSGFSNFNSKMAYYTFLDSEETNAQEFDSLVFDPDVFTINGQCAYLYLPTGAGKTKLTNHYLEKITGKICSTRNFRTTHKLVDLLNAITW